MSSYTLAATMHGEREACPIEAEDSLDATMRACVVILGRAAADRHGPWALGAIELVEDTTGAVLHTMPAKG